MPDRWLVVMLKEPRPGRVKTRLGRDIGHVRAAWWFRHQTRRLLRRIQDPRWRVVLAVAPDHAGLSSRVWPATLPRLAQGQGDLGARMVRMMRALPPGPVCVIGGDIPGLERHHVWQAFQALGPAEAVFGPAEDGGYWLVGVRGPVRHAAGLLRDVRWSTKDALADSRRSLAGRRVALVSVLADVDRASDLDRLSKRRQCQTDGSAR